MRGESHCFAKVTSIVSSTPVSQRAAVAMLGSFLASEKRKPSADLSRWGDLFELTQTLATVAESEKISCLRVKKEDPFQIIQISPPRSRVKVEIAPSSAKTNEKEAQSRGKNTETASPQDATESPITIIKQESMELEEMDAKEAGEEGHKKSAKKERKSAKKAKKRKREEA